MSHSKYSPLFSALALALAVLGFSGCSSPPYTGPSDDVIRQQVLDTLKTDSTGSEQKINFQVTKIWHDDAIESDGAHGVPKGTILFRIKCTTTMKETDETPAVVPLVVYFYRDASGAWKSYVKE